MQRVIAKARRIAEARCLLGEHRALAKSAGKVTDRKAAADRLRPLLADRLRLDAEVADRVQRDLR
jgi:hypothetical protein